MARMIDQYVSKEKMNAGIAWAIVVGLMTVAWGVMLLAPGHWQIAGMFAATACATSAYAAVLHLRCYAVRIAGLVRAMGSVQSEDRPRPVRRL